MPPRIVIHRLTQFLPRASPLQHSRPFLNLAGATGPQRFSEIRSLPYAPGPLYTLVSDIGSYHKFLPYCLGSSVTRYTDNLPTEADLRVGWGAYDETFSSKVECQPEKHIVKADASQNELFHLLKTRWEIVAKEGGKGSDVALHIEFQFKNPVYAALSGTIAPKMAGVVVEAFERRAKELLEKGEDGVVVEEIEEEERRAVG